MGWFDERFQNLHGREHCPCAARWSPSGPLIPGAEFTLWGYGPRACATLIRKEKSHPEVAFPILRPEHSHFNGSQADDNP